MKYSWPGACLCVLLLSSSLSAQVPKVQLSNTFPEPGDGFEKVMLLENGNTCYLHFDKKQGIQVKMYNAQRELSDSQTVVGKGWDVANINDTEIDGIYSINGQVVIFLQQLIKYKPSLFRLILDGTNGKLIKEDQLGELSTVLHRDIFVQNNFASHDFYTAKDPNSGYYAVAAFSAGETNQIYLYSPEHELVQQTAYTLPGETYSAFSYMDMAVQGKEHIYLATTALSTHKGNKDSASLVVISALKTGEQTFTHQLLPYTANFMDVHASVRYTKDRLQVLLTNITKTGLTKYINYLNPNNLTVLTTAPLNNTNQPQMLVPSADGATVLLENMNEFATGNSKNAYNRMHTNMNDINIIQLGTDGKEKSAYTLPKLQIANGAYEPFYLQRKQKGQWVFRNRIQALNTTPYLSYEYLPTQHGTYILFNDYLMYLDPGGMAGEKKPLRYLTEANTVCYRADALQERIFLFGNPETFKGYYCMFGASDFLADKNTYATILITRKGEEKKAAIAWVTF
jgi:hypothetical protein